MIIKCKMCGGDIQFNPGDTCGQCDHCGGTTTFPKLPDEQRTNLFNRANHFRRQCEFDKAMAAYEHILEEDVTDAEAHWGIVLSKFGIEYVEDPVTHERIPTCHRAQVISILSDEDYQNALKYAPDEHSREIYETEAKRIAEIQKGILAISSQEKPYDVFICYKEADDNGSRTKDSTLAQEIYYQLTNEGYKVFFSRITLEDKLGQEYEPYIFAALNSAKVMLVVGTKLEYFNAVWVKNEWSRYLQIMKSDRNRLLIPCYRDMDPYDLPEELSNLQSQDMSKIGFMQDLLRGVQKVLEAEKRKSQTQQANTAETGRQSSVASVAPGVESLMKRAYLFMEDGDFKSASEYLDRVLDIDPEYSAAYAAKVCVAMGIRKEANLAMLPFQFEDNTDWQKALRFATPSQKATYTGYACKVKERTQKQIRDYAYDCAIEMAVKPAADRGKLDAELSAYRQACGKSSGSCPDGSRRAGSQQNEAVFKQSVSQNEPGEVTEQNLKTAAIMLENIDDTEAKTAASQCRALAEQARQKAVYHHAMAMSNREKSNPEGLEEATRAFLSVPEYKDAKAQAQKCVEMAERIRSGLYNDAVQAMKSSGNESLKWEDTKKKLADNRLDGYRDISTLRTQAAQKYEEALAGEEETRRQAEELARRKAEAEARKKKRISIISALATVAAIAVFFLATKVIIPESNYRQAVALREAGRYSEAVEMFKNLGDHNDSATQIKATYYAEGLAKQQTQEWDAAIEAFRNAGDYSYAQMEIKVTYYAEGRAKQQAQEWDAAIEAFRNAGDYSDAQTQISETRYLQAKALMSAGNYTKAAAVMTNLKGYKDVDDLLKNNSSLAAAARETKLVLYKTVGSYVTFGTYPQTSSGNDQTAIEWLVLDYDAANGRVLLLSRYGLEAKPYNDEDTSVTWEQCTLRAWLNGEFLNKAFSVKEQSAILLTNVDNSSGQGYSYWKTDGGNNTQDRIFLLSYAEANRYLGVTYDDSDNTKSRVAPTAYAIAQGVWTSDSYQTADGKPAGWWWLRSLGYDQNSAAGVFDAGSLYYDFVFSGAIIVRPAFWLNLESDIF